MQGSSAATTAQQQLSLQTERFGPLTVDASRQVTFIEPILGFEDERHYVILQHAEDSPFWWLQSTRTPSLAFVMTQPALFGLDYQFTLPPTVAQQLELPDVESLLVFTLVTIPAQQPQQMTTNLLAPVLLNGGNQKAMQLVLPDPPAHYTTRVRLLPDNREGGAGCSS